MATPEHLQLVRLSLAIISLQIDEVARIEASGLYYLWKRAWDGLKGSAPSPISPPPHHPSPPLREELLPAATLSHSLSAPPADFCAARKYTHLYPNSYCVDRGVIGHLLNKFCCTRASESAPEQPSMFQPFHRRAKTAPSNYPRVPFHLLRFGQLLASMIVGGIMSFFMYHLTHDHWQTPWTFVLVRHLQNPPPYLSCH